MSNELLNSQDLDLEIKKLLEDIDNISSNVDLYKIILDEQLLVANCW